MVVVIVNAMGSIRVVVICFLEGVQREAACAVAVAA